MFYETVLEQETQDTHTPTVLIIDDEKPVRRFLYTALSAHGYRVFEAPNGRSGLTQIVDLQPDLILLDIDLPDIRGVDITKAVREWSQIPILILSGENQDAIKVEVLDAGADDYIVKPFNLGELMARMRVAMRHTQPLSHTSIFSNGDLYIDAVARIVKIRDHIVALTPTEYNILLYLARHNGKVVTHKQLWRRLHGEEHNSDSHLIQVHVSNLRRKLELGSNTPHYIVTEPGIGYRLRADST